MTAKHWAVLLLTAGLFGSSFFFVKLATEGLPPLTIAAGRSVIAAMAVTLALYMSKTRLPRFGRDWVPLAILGLLTAAIPYIGIAWGQTLIDSSLGGILFAAIPVFSVVIAPVFLAEETFTPSRLAGALLGLAGVALVIGPAVEARMDAQFLGAAVTLGAALSYAFGGIYARTQYGTSPMVLAAGQLITASLVLVPLALLLDRPWTLAPDSVALASLAIVGLVATAVPVLLMFWLVRNAGATNTSLLALFMPLAAVFLGVVFLDEGIAGSAWIGLAAILTSAAIVTGTHTRLFRSRRRMA